MNLDWLLTGEGPMRQGEAPAAPSPEVFTYLPLVAVRPSAGAGAEVYSERIVDNLAFKTSWLHAYLHANVHNLVVMMVEGESMEPHISTGDVVLVDRSDNELIRDGIHVLRMGNALMIKRLQRLPGDQVEASSFNPAYKPFQVNLADLGTEIAIIGRVLWVGHRL